MTRHDPTLSAQAAADPICDGTVHCLRHWTTCPEATRLALVDRFGSGADRILLSLSPFIRTLARYGERPLTRHLPDCPDRTRDERLLAQLVTAAASQQREEALLIAITLIRPDLAPVLVAQAEALGLTLYSHAARMVHGPRPAADWLH